MAHESDLNRIWNASDPKASEVSFRELLSAAEGDPSRLVELNSYIARSESAQGKLAEAKASLQKAEHLLEATPACRVSAKIRWLLEVGRLYILERTPSQARIRSAEAWTLALQSGEDYLAVDAALMMAEIEPQKVQQEWIRRAIQLAESSSLGGTKRWLGSLYTSLGWKQFELRQHTACLATFEKALTHLKADGSDRERFVAQWAIGKVLRILGRGEEALTIQNALLAELNIGGAKDGRLFEELAECLHSLKRTPEAKIYFELAYRELSVDPWVMDNEPAKLKRLKDLGQVR
jgi:tetratricopeptide (TPR) repeat protein